ncbi:MAG TPA: glycosyltransferase, partial [Chloroflexia bacterium]|nr:glycosyltransferase [Chloroflexia bacterium]
TGGQVVYILELAQALGRQGVAVDIVTRQFAGRRPVEELGAGARIIRIPCGPDAFVIKEQLYELMPELVRNLIRYMRAEAIQYDAIHSHYWDGGYAGLLLQRKLQVPHIFTPHSLGQWKARDMAQAPAPSAQLAALYRYDVRIATEKKIMRAADTILMLSQIQRIKLLRDYAVDFDKVRVLYPGVDTRIFHPGPPQRSGNRAMETPNNILLVSRFVPAKGIDSAIEAFRLLADQVEAYLYIVTSNSSDMASAEEVENERQIQGLIRRYGLQERVRFLGFVSDRSTLAEYYRRASVFLLPSRYEPFGLTSMEALASGTVALISRAAGCRELIIDGVNGFLVDMQAPAAVATLIRQLLADKTQAARVAENEVLTIQKHFSWDITAQKLIRAIYPGGAGAAPPATDVAWEVD